MAWDEQSEQLLHFSSFSTTSFYTITQPMLDPELTKPTQVKFSATTELMVSMVDWECWSRLQSLGRPHGTPELAFTGRYPRVLIPCLT
ncbi:MAG: hypothetical protein ACLSAC_10755 [Enterocloster bolteae]